MKLPKISSYGNYSSSNYGLNSLVVDIGSLSLYFSYQTVIAFNYKGEEFVSENNWGSTTGKHLNWINRDKSVRLERKEFETKLEEILGRLEIQI